MNPFEKIVAAFGSQSEVAKAAGCSEAAVSFWKRNGIPDWRRAQLLKVARDRGLDLSGEDVDLPEWARGNDAVEAIA